MDSPLWVLATHLMLVQESTSQSHKVQRTNHSDEVKIYELRVGTAKSATDMRIPIRQMAVSTDGSQYHTCLHTTHSVLVQYSAVNFTKPQNAQHFSQHETCLFCLTGIYVANFAVWLRMLGNHQSGWIADSMPWTSGGYGDCRGISLSLMLKCGR